MRYSYRIEQAIRAASVLHRNQVRKGTTPFPYVTHLFAVAMIVADYTHDEDTIVAALLHDTLEDTDYTADELHDDFGPRVRDLVVAISQPRPQVGERFLRWSEQKKQYIQKLKKAPEEALIIAAADKIHNMRCVVEEYYDDHAQFIADFGGSLHERLVLYHEISNVLNRNLANAILSEFNHVFGEYKKFIEYVIRAQES